MRGRRPSGPEMLDRMEGSEVARERVKVVLQTMAGELRVQEACEVLHLSEQRFEELRAELLEAAVDRLEPRRAGRPPRVVSESDFEIARLRTRIAELEAELKASQIRAELAAFLPRRVSGKR